MKLLIVAASIIHKEFILLSLISWIIILFMVDWRFINVINNQAQAFVIHLILMLTCCNWGIMELWPSKHPSLLTQKCLLVLWYHLEKSSGKMDVSDYKFCSSGINKYLILIRFTLIYVNTPTFWYLMHAQMIK